MSNIFFCSDHHFAHNNILTFKNWDGSMLRPGFIDVEHMNETMVERHNAVVKPEDRVYFLGDVAMGKRGLEYLSRMVGRKVLIKGNHDKESVNTYMKYFDDIRGSHQFDGMILTHIPIRPQSLGRWGTNVHGHLHSNNVLLGDPPAGDEYEAEPKGQIDTRYFCVAMEQVNYTPISLEELKAAIKSRN
jgi:calcineurin-like phosphoesterase family protein